MFHHFLDDIRKGENIDLYLTILAALLFVVLNLIGVASLSFLAPLTLAVLGLLAVTNLGNRHRMEELLAQKELTLNDFFRQDYPQNYQSDIDTAGELWLVGVSLNRTIKYQYLRLEKILRRGGRVRVLLVHPQGPGLEMAVERGYTRRDVQTKRGEILTGLGMLEELRMENPEGMELRTIQHPLSYGATVIDPDNSNGAIYMEHYTFRVTTESHPRYMLRTQDGYWYDFFKSELRTLWEAGQVWEQEAEE